MFSFVFAHAEVFLPLFSIDLAVELILLTPHAGDIVRPACEKRRWQALHGGNDTKNDIRCDKLHRCPVRGPVGGGSASGVASGPPAVWGGAPPPGGLAHLPPGRVRRQVYSDREAPCPT